MNADQFSREVNYRVALHFVNMMYAQGIISDDILQRWDAALVRECDPPIEKLYQRRIDNPA